MTTKTKARPILFSTPMVRALLAGTKTQTRRAIKRPLKHPGWTQYVYFGPSANNPACESQAIECGADYPDDDDDVVRCPYGAAGDLLWVRESWAARLDQNHLNGSQLYESGMRHAGYWADGPGKCCNTGCDGAAGRVRSARFMPRWASRLTLRITEVRVQRLQDMSDADATAEGVEWESADPPFYYVPGLSAETGVGVEEFHKHPEVVCYSKLWEHINGAGSWAANPWVWAISFEVIQKNVTEIPTNG